MSEPHCDALHCAALCVEDVLWPLLCLVPKCSHSHCCNTRAGGRQR